MVVSRASPASQGSFSSLHRRASSICLAVLICITVCELRLGNFVYKWQHWDKKGRGLPLHCLLVAVVWSEAVGWLLARRKGKSLFSTGSGLKKHLFRNRTIDICPQKVFFGKISVMWKAGYVYSLAFSLMWQSYWGDNCVPSWLTSMSFGRIVCNAKWIGTSNKEKLTALPPLTFQLCKWAVLKWEK